MTTGRLETSRTREKGKPPSEGEKTKWYQPTTSKTRGGCRNIQESELDCGTVRKASISKLRGKSRSN